MELNCLLFPSKKKVNVNTISVNKSSFRIESFLSLKKNTKHISTILILSILL